MNPARMSMVEEIEKFARALSVETEEIYIVNAGLMNVGKSRLFNALVDQEELFRVGDIPTTAVCQTVKAKGINFVDTPGIGARKSDTEEAFQAYRNADMILFVHNANMGELHNDEIIAINEIRKEFPLQLDFWRRFCLVISRADLRKDEDIAIIIDKIKLDMRNHCGGEGFPLYVTSAERYWKGIHQKQPVFIEKSGIKQLGKFLLDSSQYLQLKAMELRQERLNERKREEVAACEKKKNINADNIVMRRRKYMERIKLVSEELEGIQNRTMDYWMKCKDLADEVRNLR